MTYSTYPTPDTANLDHLDFSDGISEGLRDAEIAFTYSPKDPATAYLELEADEIADWLRHLERYELIEDTRSEGAKAYSRGYLAAYRAVSRAKAATYDRWVNWCWDFSLEGN